MTAIGGIVDFSDAEIESEHLNMLHHAQEIYGKERSSQIRGGYFAFSKTYLDIRYSDKFEKNIPYDLDRETSLLFDGRVDNLDEICLLSGVKISDGRHRMSTADVVHRLLDLNGVQAVAKVAGDFSLAYYEKRERRLFLARDTRGSRPLYWSRVGNRLAFSSSPNALLALPWISKGLNRYRLLEFLSHIPNKSNESYFESIFRIIPGSSVCFSRYGEVKEQFHRWNVGFRQKLGSDLEYVEAFSEVLEDAVRKRIQGVTDAGVQMSSGLDSTTIAVVAADQLRLRDQQLFAYTSVPSASFVGAVPKGRHPDEGPGAAAVVSLNGNIKLRKVLTKWQQFPSRLGKTTALWARPVLNSCNAEWLNKSQEMAAEDGVKVLLRAPAGNMTISHDGASLLPYLFSRGRFHAWFGAASSVRRQRPGVGYRHLLSLSSTPLLQETRLFSYWLTRNRVNNMFANCSINPKWREDKSFLERAKKALRPKGIFKGTLNSFQTFDWIEAFDPGDYNLAANARGVELSDPSSDDRLFEFCLSIPEDQFLRNGETSSLLKRLMNGRLPKEILESRTRGIQEADWYEKLDFHRDEIFQFGDLLYECPQVRDIIDCSFMMEAATAWRPASMPIALLESTYRLKWLRGLAVACFIRQYS